MSWGSYFLSFRGRLSRSRYWSFWIGLSVADFCILALAFRSGSEFSLILLVPIIIVCLFSGSAVITKRLHDRGKNAWWIIPFFVIPIVLNRIAETAQTQGGYALYFITVPLSFWALAELGFLRGTVGDNRYGPDPVLSTEVGAPQTMLSETSDVRSAGASTANNVRAVLNANAAVSANSPQAPVGSIVWAAGATAVGAAMLMAALIMIPHKQSIPVFAPAPTQSEQSGVAPKPPYTTTPTSSSGANSVGISAIAPVPTSAAQVPGLPDAALATHAAPSFDCGIAKKWSELRVCAIPALAEDDQLMGELFKQLIYSLASSDRASIRSDQKNWIASRDLCFEDSNPIACLSEAYETRIAALRAHVSMAAAAPSAPAQTAADAQAGVQSGVAAPAPNAPPIGPAPSTEIPAAIPEANNVPQPPPERRTCTAEDARVAQLARKNGYQYDPNCT